MSGGTAAAQIRPVELVDILSTDLQRRYENAFAWSEAVSTFLTLPGLRGFWPMSSLDENGDAYDVSGQGRVLTNNSVYYAWTGLAHHGNFVLASTAYLSRADESGLDVLGTESYILLANRGLTIGGWFRPTAAGTDTGLMSKYVTAGNQRSYLLRKTSGDVISLLVSTDGIAAVAGGTTVVSVNNWYFIVGRFTPSTELATFVNGTKTTNLVGVPASIFNSTAAFDIGRYNATNYFTGSGCLCFLCATALSDTIIQALLARTRPLFGV